MTVKDRRLIAPPDIKHGTRNGYINHSCRCPRCRRAQADYMAEYRAKRAEARRMTSY